MIAAECEPTLGLLDEASWLESESSCWAKITATLQQTLEDDCACRQTTSCLQNVTAETNEMVGVETREPPSVRCKTWYNVNLRLQRSSSHTDCVVAHIRCRLLPLLSVSY